MGNLKDNKINDLDRKLGIEIRKCIICNFEFYVLKKQIYQHCPNCIAFNRKLQREYEEKIKQQSQRRK